MADTLRNLGEVTVTGQRLNNGTRLIEIAVSGEHYAGMSIRANGAASPLEFTGGQVPAAHLAAFAEALTFVAALAGGN